MFKTISTHKSALRAALGIGCSLAALSFGTSAFGQPLEPQAEPQQSGQATPQPGVSEQDIIVTAQFRAQRLQDTPIAITAVNSAMLEARSQTNLAELTNQAPNVNLKPQGGSFGPSIIASIRGVGQVDFNPAFEPGVGLYIDDVYYATLTGSLFDLLDVDRVEILRGPQGTLAGRNSIGGAVKMFSKKPVGDEGGYLEATYGSADRIGLRGAADFTIAQNLYARISGVYKHQDGYVDRLDFGCVNPPGSALNPNPVNPGDPPAVPATRTPGKCKISEQGEIDYAAVRGILRWEPSEGTDFMLIGDYTRDSRTVAGEVLRTTAPPISQSLLGYPYGDRFVCGRYCNYSTYFNAAAPSPLPGVFPPLIQTQADDRVKFTGWGVSLNGTIALTDDIDLVSITAYRAYDALFNADDDLSPSFNGLGQNDLSFWFFSQELRLNGEIGDTINYTVGGYYSKQKSVYFSLQDIRYIGIPLQFFQDDPTRADSLAAFANVSWEPVEGLNINGGLRYTDESKRYTFVRRNPDGSGGNLFVGAVDGQEAIYDGPPSTRFDYRLSVDYRFSPELMAYASIVTGFKGGGISPRPFTPAQVISFGPEKLTAYEIGVKSDLLDNRVRVNVSAFYNDYSDIQGPLIECPQFGGPPCGAWASLGDGVYKGFEVETTIAPVEGLLIDGSLSYLDFHYTSINPQAGGPANPGGPQLDSPAVNVPDWKWSIGAQYEIPLGSAGSITPRMDLSWQDRTFQGNVLDPSGARVPNYLPSYTIGNARLTWRNEPRDLEVALEVTNLFDKYYILSQFDLRAAGAGFYKILPARPREWAITVKKTF